MATVVVEVYRVGCTECGGARGESGTTAPARRRSARGSKTRWGGPAKEGSGIAGGTAVRAFGAAGIADRQALPSALGREAEKSAAAAHGSGRDSPRQEGEVPHGGQQSGNGQEPLWFGKGAKKRRWTNTSGGNSTNGRGGRLKLPARGHRGNRSTKSILKWSPGCRIVFDKFHVMQHANDAIDEVRRAEFFPQGNEDA